MKKSILTIITDTAFFAFAAFLLFLSVFKRTVKVPFSYILSALLSLLFSLGVFKFLSARRKKGIIKYEEKEKAETALMHLTFMKKTEINELFKKAFIFYGKPFKKTGSLFSVPSEKTVYYVSFGIDGAYKADAVKLYNSLKDGEKGKIFCYSADRETEEFVARFNGRISVIKGERVYSFLKSNDALPDVKIFPLKKEKKRFDKNVILNKKRAKNYLVFGSVFMTMSFFVRFNAYYIAFGAAFLILSVIALLFGKSETEKEL